MKVGQIKILQKSVESGTVLGNLHYCVGHQNPPFSSQTWQGATAVSFCQILDREEALESSNAEI